MRDAAARSLHARLRRRITATQWNSMAVAKIVKKARRRLGREAAPRPGTSASHQRPTSRVPCSSKRWPPWLTPLPFPPSPPLPTAVAVLRNTHFHYSLGAARSLAQLPPDIVQQDSNDHMAPAHAAAASASSAAPPTLPSALASDSEPEEDDGPAKGDCHGGLFCPVCLDSAVRPVMLACAHVFCTACLEPTVSCPVCRKEHNSTAVRIGSGDTVRLPRLGLWGGRAPARTPGPAPRWQTARDTLCYIVLLTLIMPFLTVCLVLGTAWTVTHKVSLAIVKKKRLPLPDGVACEPHLSSDELQGAAPPPWNSLSAL